MGWLAPRALSTLLFSLLAGCASDRQVYLEVPIARMEPPTAAPRMMDIGLVSGGAARIELTPDQTTTSPDPDHPVISSHHSGAGRFDIQAARPVVVSVRAFGADLYGVQGKWLAFQPMPGEHFSLALTLAYGKGDRHYRFDGSGLDSHTDIKQTMTDGALILGWQLTRDLLLFGGPYYSHHDYHGSYYSARGSSPDVNLDFEGLAVASGGNVALAVTPANWVQIIGEYSVAKVEAGSSGRNIGRASLAVQFVFGPRTYPDAAKPSDKPEVVPPDTPGAGG